MTDRPRREVWAADVALDRDQTAALVASQFPELAPVRLIALGVGFDNWAWRVNEAHVFRFPRRAIAARFLAIETAVLPRLAGRLPLPVPAPSHRGRPTSEYPYPFAGYPYVPGRSACSAALTDAQRAASAEPLARFLRALHATPIDDGLARAAPLDEIGRADLSLRTRIVEARGARVRDRDPDAPIDAAIDAVRALASTPPWTAAPRLVHGDLYARHLLVGTAGEVCGVIDWGDVHRGDPALDLSIAWSFLPPAARPAFRAAYGPIDDATWLRARFRAWFYGVVLLDYGLVAGDPGMATAGRDALRLAALT